MIRRIATWQPKISHANLVVGWGSDLARVVICPRPQDSGTTYPGATRGTRYFAHLGDALINSLDYRMQLLGVR